MSWFSNVVAKARDVLVEIGARVANLGLQIEERLSEALEPIGPIAEPATAEELAGLDYRQPFLTEAEALEYLADVAAPSRIVTVSYPFQDPVSGEHEETILYYPVIEGSP